MGVKLLRNVNGNFETVLTVHRVRKDGGFSLPEKWMGSIESYCVRTGAKFLVAESAARDVDYEFGSLKFRVSRI